MKRQTIRSRTSDTVAVQMHKPECNRLGYRGFAVKGRVELYVRGCFVVVIVPDRYNDFGHVYHH